MITRFTNDLFPNCHIEFDNKGTKLRVSLNIEPRMKKHLSPNNVFKAEKFWIYSIASYVENPNFKTMSETYKTLINRAMINCREAKRKALKNEIKQLSLNLN